MLVLNFLLLRPMNCSKVMLMNTTTNAEHEAAKAAWKRIFAAEAAKGAAKRAEHDAAVAAWKRVLRASK